MTTLRARVTDPIVEAATNTVVAIDGLHLPIVTAHDLDVAMLIVDLRSACWRLIHTASRDTSCTGRDR
jgi:hypothetical protein